MIDYKNWSDLSSRIKTEAFSLKSPRQITGIYLIFAVFFLTVLALGLRLSGLGAESLWGDEGFSRTMTLIPFEVLTTRFLDTNPSMFWIVAWATTRLGDGEFELRLGSALFGAATVPVFFLLSKRYLGGIGALVASVFLAISTFHIYYSQEARAYAVLNFFLVACMFSLVRFIESLDEPEASQNKRLKFFWGGLYALTAICAAYTHLSALIFLTILNVMVLPMVLPSLRRSVKPAVSWIGVNLLAVLFMLPLATLVLSGGAGRFSWLEQPSLSLALSTLAANVRGELVASGLLVQLVFLAVFVTGFALLIRRQRWSPLVILCLTASIAFPALMYVLGFAKPIFMAKTIGVAVIGGGILVGAVAAYGNLKIAVPLLVIVFGFQAKALTWYYTKDHKHEWRTVSQLLDTQMGENDAIAMCTDIPYDVLNYYFKGGQSVFAISPGPNGRMLTELHWEPWLEQRSMPFPPPVPAVQDAPKGMTWDEVASRYDTVWLIEGHCKSHEGYPEWRDTLADDLTPAHRYRGIYLYKFD